MGWWEIWEEEKWSVVGLAEKAGHFGGHNEYRVLNRDTGNYIVHNWQLHQPWVTGAPRRRNGTIFLLKSATSAYEVIYATGVRHMTKEEYQALKDLPIEEIKPFTHNPIDYSTDQEAEHDSDGVIVEDNGQAVKSANTAPLTM